MEERKQPSGLSDVYIIRGNPDVDTANADKYEQMYKQVGDIVSEYGFSHAQDPGLERTLPPGGKIWIGHSRGGSRLRLAPSNVRTLRLDDYEPEEARRAQDQEYQRLFKELGVSSIQDVPLDRRPQPGPEHYTLNENAIAAIRQLLRQQQLQDRRQAFQTPPS